MEYRDIDVDKIEDKEQLEEIHASLKEQVMELYRSTLDINSVSRDTSKGINELLSENEQLKRDLELANYRMKSLPVYKEQEETMTRNNIFANAKITK